LFFFESTEERRGIGLEKAGSGVVDAG